MVFFFSFARRLSRSSEGAVEFPLPRRRIRWAWACRGSRCKRGNLHSKEDSELRRLQKLK